jgi:hypothetical protein
MTFRCDYKGCENPGTVLWHNGMDVYCSQHAEQFRMSGQWLEKALRLKKAAKG